MDVNKKYNVDLEKELKLVSVLGTTTGDALRAFYYNVDRNTFRIKLTLEHPEAAEVLHYICMSKVIMIEDIRLTVSILTYNNILKVYDQMDIYYAFFDTLSKCVKDSVRLTQESWNPRCVLQTRVSFPRNPKGAKIELRKGVNAEGKRERSSVGKLTRETAYELIETNFNGTITGLFMQVFKDITGAYIFWDMENVFGIMLDDYKIIPLKVNEATYAKICAVFNFKPAVSEESA